MTGSSAETLRDGFLASSERFPNRPALEVAGERHTYAELLERARTLAATAQRTTAGDEPRLTAVLGGASVGSCAGILAALLRGHGYVPLSPSHPVPRLRDMLERTGARCVFVDASGLAVLPELAAGLRLPITFVLPESLASDLPAPVPAPHRVVDRTQLVAASRCILGSARASDVAYVLFTSGSTGVPKGVMVAHRNITHFVRTAVERYAVHEHDRLSQCFDLTFDLSLFDLFVAWSAGACVCCPSAADKLMPARYITGAELTLWFSVPSAAALMRRLKQLKAGAYPQLRACLFCGEALTEDVAEAFARAAPNAIVENLYGPTEATLACTAHRYEARAEGSSTAVVPIGKPLPGCSARLVDDALHDVGDGPGELLVAGAQVSLGYLNDAARTTSAFVRLGAERELFYRTGDRALRDASGNYHFLGRTDDQVKVRGYRIELGDVESALRAAPGVLHCAAVAAGAMHEERALHAFVCLEPGTQLTSVMDATQSALPPHMHPAAYHALEELPRNSNGKVDRRALAERVLHGAG